MRSETCHNNDVVPTHCGCDDVDNCIYGSDSFIVLTQQMVELTHGTDPRKYLCLQTISSAAMRSETCHNNDVVPTHGGCDGAVVKSTWILQGICL
jgi:hypothetical protein